VAANGEIPWQFDADQCSMVFPLLFFSNRVRRDLLRRETVLPSDRTMKSHNFVVTHRPRLAEITDHPKIEFADYERQLRSLQGVLQLAQQAYLGTPERALLVLEGWDTAGKGGLVRRLGWALDPRSFKVHPIAAPDEHERAQHYLQRFWRGLPEKGQIVAFDRSWYGRVLVERVEGFATNKEWRRAYREINEFERVLIDSGIRLVKLFLHITTEEQLRRFRDRLIDPLKRWKLSYEDFRNRARRSDYEMAIEDMIGETSTKHAPWHLIPANDKPYGRIAAFRVIADRLARDVSLEARPIDPKLLEQAKRALNLSASDIERASQPGRPKVVPKWSLPEK
jgi:AMP-polyphosphate phosphotransferase